MFGGGGLVRMGWGMKQLTLATTGFERYNCVSVPAIAVAGSTRRRSLLEAAEQTIHEDALPLGETGHSWPEVSIVRQHWRWQRGRRDFIEEQLSDASAHTIRAGGGPSNYLSTRASYVAVSLARIAGRPIGTLREEVWLRGRS